MIISQDSVPRVDLVGLDRVPGLAHLVGVDGPSGVHCPGVFCQLENSFRSLSNLEFACVLDCFSICQVE